MSIRIVVFEDNPEDQKLFRDLLGSHECEILVVDHARPEDELDRIRKFGPQAAVVDSIFGTDIDGMRIVRFLQQEFPEIPVVVCTILLADTARRSRIYRAYRDAPGVCAVLSKEPFPSAEDILAACDAV